MSGKIIKIHSTTISNWYQSIIRKGKKIAVGFGTTPQKALENSLKSISN